MADAFANPHPLTNPNSVADSGAYPNPDSCTNDYADTHASNFNSGAECCAHAFIDAVADPNRAYEAQAQTHSGRHTFVTGDTGVDAHTHVDAGSCYNALADADSRYVALIDSDSCVQSHTRVDDDSCDVPLGDSHTCFVRDTRSGH
jgi:hypothetical protein